MKQKINLSILLFFSLAFGLVYFWQETAEAARMGRSRSFGSKPSYQRSAPAPAQAPKQAVSPTKPGQTTQTQPIGGAPASPLGRWGGMLGGLLMGGLIGSMLFGGGHGSGGAGLLDLLLIGGGLYLLFRYLRARRMATEFAQPGGPSAGAMSFDRGAAPAWGSANYAPPQEPAAAPVPDLPPGFDADDFLKGANAIYVRLQAAWDKRDLEDIRQFASAEVFAEIQHQAQEDPVPGKTELLLINPRIIEVRDTGSQTIVSVLYDVMLREDEDDLSKQVRELWHFSRDRNAPDAFWLLEGIQQVE